MTRDDVLLINLSGRGDKDVLSVQSALAPKAEAK
jgi:tryptophan synthase beta subunit